LGFQKQRSETLHPEFFNCRRCDRQEKDLRNNCPTCELSVMEKDYLEGAKQQILKRVGGFPKGWTLERLMFLHGEISDLLAMGKNKISKRWNVRVIRLTEILQSERQHFRAVSDFQHMERIKNQTPPAGNNTLVQLH
jgi:hypothetical protein